MQCDESKSDDISPFIRFADVVKQQHTNFITIAAAIESTRTFLVGPDDEATLKKNVPLHFEPRSLFLLQTRQEKWASFVNRSFRALESAARVFFTTCSGAALLKSKELIFTMVVIDEAGKATQPDSFVPISLLADVTQHATRVVLVGDDAQLRPQIGTREYEDTHLSRSLFERMHERRFPFTMLREQFRMHPSIRQIVSRLSYRNKLRDSSRIKERHSSLYACNDEGIVISDHVAFIDCNGREEREGNSSSVFNAAEVDVVLRLLPHLIRVHMNHDTATIAVLSPYNAQVRRMKEQYEGSPQPSPNVTFCSVDASQGKEFDAVVLSLVRTAKLGFLTDKRRINVALSRAQHQLIVVGCEQYVKNAPPIRQFIECIGMQEVLQVEEEHPLDQTHHATSDRSHATFTRISAWLFDVGKRFFDVREVARARIGAPHDTHRASNDRGSGATFTMISAWLKRLVGFRQVPQIGAPLHDTHRATFDNRVVLDSPNCRQPICAHTEAIREPAVPYCGVCQKGFNSDTVLQDHLRGAPHQKALRRARAADATLKT
jgi:hypothetical protein